MSQGLAELAMFDVASGRRRSCCWSLDCLWLLGVCLMHHRMCDRCDILCLPLLSDCLGFTGELRNMRATFDGAAHVHADARWPSGRSLRSCGSFCDEAAVQGRRSLVRGMHAFG